MKRMKVSSWNGDVKVGIISESAKEIVFKVYDYEFSIVGKGNHAGRDLEDANWFKVICEGEEVFNGYRDNVAFCFVSPYGAFRSDKNIVAAAAMIVALIY